LVELVLKQKNPLGATVLVLLILVLSRRFSGSNGEDDFEGFSSKFLSGNILQDLKKKRGSLFYSSEDVFFKQIDMSDLKIGERIGKGTFGEVYKGVWNGTEVGM
jgi:hypothetical protein